MHCLIDESARTLYLGLLAELSRKFGCALHAYVLMSNHVHLLLTPEDKDSASKLMHGVAQRFALAFNRRCERSGYMWEGRFYSSLVDSRGYLLRCHRYIELNPVRAGLVRYPWQYPWSSYRANAEGQESLLITPHPELLALGGDGETRRAVYRQLFDSAPTTRDLDEIRVACTRGYALGSEAFISEVERLTGMRAKAPERTLRERRG